MGFNVSELEKEVSFKASRSGGKGGQHVNKVSSKVALLFDLHASRLFTDEEKQRIALRLQGRIGGDGVLQLISQEERSQLLNKGKALARLAKLLTEAVKKPKKRKATVPGASAIAARLENKRRRGAKKASRRLPAAD